ncbi:hypothetical protein HZH68_015537 [Vespula germanica]|uniref:Uncharacterized protein n=1 Tax=Vespula germanica TaxID=30212 RepID=A0A834J626_VESGE|nr:hypothetical protein HZH68_015537 [Vespula germanica]
MVWDDAGRRRGKRRDRNGASLNVIEEEDYEKRKKYVMLTIPEVTDSKINKKEKKGYPRAEIMDVGEISPPSYSVLLPNYEQEKEDEEEEDEEEEEEEEEEDIYLVRTLRIAWGPR